MVLVHEWGHFIVAKSFGVRVEIFSIGFGTRLWGVKRGDTDYRISALPLGGYVKMAGDNPLEERKGDPDEFLVQASLAARADRARGPGDEYYSLRFARRRNLHARQQAACATWTSRWFWRACCRIPRRRKRDYRPGDQVVKINGSSNPTWDEARLELMSTLPGHSLPMVVDRNGQEISLSVPVGRNRSKTFLDIPPDRLVIGSVSSGMPAERSGLKEGDADSRK